MTFTSAVIVGVAVGDALGAPFEKKKQSDPALLWWDGRYKSSKDHPWNHNLEPGQFTDDTQMTMVLADYILKNPVPEVKFQEILNPGILAPWFTGLAEQYATWCHREHPFTGKARGAGGTTKESLEKFLDTGVLSPIDGALGTGPIMRASPYAIVCKSKGTAKFLAVQDSLITHEDPIVRKCVEKYVGYLHDLVHFEGERNPCEKKLFTSVTPGSTLPGGRMQRIDTAMEAAFACFDRTNSFDTAIQMAVRLGGDTDTVASLTGALAGAWYGLEGIHPTYLNGLERVADLQELNRELNRVGASMPNNQDTMVRKVLKAVNDGESCRERISSVTGLSDDKTYRCLLSLALQNEVILGPEGWKKNHGK